MYLSDGNGFIEFKPVAYEFPELSKTHKHYDHFDSNWLKIEFTYSDHNSIKRKETDACVLTFEMAAFIRDMKLLDRGELNVAELDTMEPYLKIKVERISDEYTVTVDFQGFIEESDDFERICVNKTFTTIEIKEFIYQLETEYTPFPQR